MDGTMIVSGPQPAGERRWEPCRVCQPRSHESGGRIRSPHAKELTAGALYGHSRIRASRGRSMR